VPQRKATFSSRARVCSFQSESNGVCAVILLSVREATASEFHVCWIAVSVYWLDDIRASDRRGATPCYLAGGSDSHTPSAATSYIRKLDSETRQAYIFLAIGVAGLVAWSLLLSGRLQSFKAADFEARFNQVERKVETTSDLIEKFYQLKKVQSFDDQNWNNYVKKVGISGSNVILEVTLEEPPIPGSIEIFEGPLPMLNILKVNDRAVQFLANTDKPTSGLTIKYHPRAASMK
jgi:hypothetical protein